MIKSLSSLAVVGMVAGIGTLHHSVRDVKGAAKAKTPIRRAHTQFNTKIFRLGGLEVRQTHSREQMGLSLARDRQFRKAKREALQPYNGKLSQHALGKETPGALAMLASSSDSVYDVYLGEDKVVVAHFTPVSPNYTMVTRSTVGLGSLDQLVGRDNRKVPKDAVPRQVRSLVVGEAVALSLDEGSDLPNVLVTEMRGSLQQADHLLRTVFQQEGWKVDGTLSQLSNEYVVRGGNTPLILGAMRESHHCTMVVRVKESDVRIGYLFRSLPDAL
ncbi:MAG: hypothetical protein K9N51_05710 [Candidatus Pacebacteria bacterium]|nr:hypothetical protein [Candidatus Paceibacterota bacterium]